MAGKFYAVRTGKKTGIFLDWNTCKMQVDGFKGAEYKSFKTKQEAEDYLSNTQPFAIESENESEAVPAITEAYVDGSYNNVTQEFSYGMIILSTDGNQYKFAEKFRDSELALMHNVAGEIKGAEAAMRYAVKFSLEKIVIYHDYAGISKWCLNEWKTNKDGTKAYKAFFDEVNQKVKIRFEKVTGHSNNKYNDIADELAKQALGLIEEKHELSAIVLD